MYTIDFKMNKLGSKQDFSKSSRAIVTVGLAILQQSRNHVINTVLGSAIHHVVMGASVRAFLRNRDTLQTTGRYYMNVQATTHGHAQSTHYCSTIKYRHTHLNSHLVEINLHEKRLMIRETIT